MEKWQINVYLRRTWNLSILSMGMANFFKIKPVLENRHESIWSKVKNGIEIEKIEEEQ